jgi:hypothetical protein
VVKINKKDILMKNVYAYHNGPMLFSATYKGHDYLLLPLDPMVSEGRYLVCYNEMFSVDTIHDSSEEAVHMFIKTSSLWITEYDESNKVKAYPVKFEDLPSDCLPLWPFITGVKTQ